MCLLGWFTVNQGIQTCAMDQTTLLFVCYNQTQSVSARCRVWLDWKLCLMRNPLWNGSSPVTAPAACSHIFISHSVFGLLLYFLLIRCWEFLCLALNKGSGVSALQLLLFAASHWPPDPSSAHFSLPISGGGAELAASPSCLAYPRDIIFQWIAFLLFITYLLICRFFD